MGKVKPNKSILDTKIAVPLMFKFLTITIICIISISVIGEKAMYLLFIYPWDLIFSVLIIALNYKEKPLNKITLIFVILVPILLLIRIPAEFLSIEVLQVFGKYWRDIGFWGGLVTIILLVFDIISFRSKGVQKGNS